MKDIKGYENLYGITSCGRVWSYKRKKFLKNQLDKDGYLCVDLYKNNKKKRFFIHRLVALSYIPNPNGYATVDHIDSNKEHNYISNLQWMTNEDNVKKAISRKVMCIETGQIFDSIGEAAKSINRAICSLSNCLHGRTTSCAGLHWKII